LKPQGREHKAVQEYLQQAFSPNLKLEHPFPRIKRIADCALLYDKFIFEIQSSPIPLKEVESRIEDYKKEGFSVIWILHDRFFNKKTLSESEFFLRKKHPSFFTNIDPMGQGFIYDQKERFYQMKRIETSHLKKIDLTRPKRLFYKKRMELLIAQAKHLYAAQLARIHEAFH